MKCGAAGEAAHRMRAFHIPAHSRAQRIYHEQSAISTRDIWPDGNAEDFNWKGLPNGKHF